MGLWWCGNTGGDPGGLLMTATYPMAGHACAQMPQDESASPLQFWPALLPRQWPRCHRLTNPLCIRGAGTLQRYSKGAAWLRSRASRRHRGRAWAAAPRRLPLMSRRRLALFDATAGSHYVGRRMCVCASRPVLDGIQYVSLVWLRLCCYCTVCASRCCGCTDWVAASYASVSINVRSMGIHTVATTSIYMPICRTYAICICTRHGCMYISA